MFQDPADKMVAELGTAQPATVGLVVKQALSTLGIGQVEVDMQPAAGTVIKWLGHVGGDGTVLFCHLGGCHFEESDPVGRGESILVVKVDLVLAIPILVVRLVNAPAELVERGHQFLKVTHYRCHGAEVIAWFCQVIDLVRIPGGNRTILVTGYQEVFRFHADVEDVA